MKMLVDAIEQLPSVDCTYWMRITMDTTGSQRKELYPSTWQMQYFGLCGSYDVLLGIKNNCVPSKVIT